jgi:tetratricopeptide (TPR) repeat protein
MNLEEETRFQRGKMARRLSKRWLCAGALCTTLMMVWGFSLSSTALAQEARWKALNNQAEELFIQGKHHEALSLAEEALEIAELTFGPNHPHVVTSLDTLVILYEALGMHAEAEPLYERALAIQIKALKPDQPQMKALKPDQPQIKALRPDQPYVGQGKSAKAEAYYKWAQNILEKTMPEHLNVAKTVRLLHWGLVGLFCLVFLLLVLVPLVLRPILGPWWSLVRRATQWLWERRKTWKQHITAGLKAYRRGYSAKAKEHFTTALKIADRFGPTDPRISESYKNLAKLHPTSNGLYALMALATEDAIKKEEALGPNHPDLAESLDKLARLYAGLTSKWQVAMQLYTRALAIRERTLGPEHPLVFKQALAIREKTLGPEHPLVAASLENLALVYHQAMRMHDYTESLFKRALAIRERTLGPEHPLVATTLDNLADHYHREWEFEDAELLRKRALDIREKELGPGHPDVAFSIGHWIWRYDEITLGIGSPDSLILPVISIWEKALGLEDPDHDRPVEPSELVERVVEKAVREFPKERLDLKVEKGPQDFAEGMEVTFERISVTDEQIKLLKFVTKPAKDSTHEEGLVGGPPTCEIITPKTALEHLDLVPPRDAFKNWTELGKAVRYYIEMLHYAGRKDEKERLERRLKEADERFYKPPYFYY